MQGEFSSMIWTISVRVQAAV